MFIDELERIAAPFELYVDGKGVLWCMGDLVDGVPQGSEEDGAADA